MSTHGVIVDMINLEIMYDRSKINKYLLELSTHFFKYLILKKINYWS